MTPRTKWLGLIGLTLVWLALIYVFVIDVPPPQEVPLKYKSGQLAASTNPKGPVDNWEVRSLHARARELPGTPKRNIFASPALPLSPEAKVRLAAIKNKPAEAAKPVSDAPAAPPPPPPPSPEEVARQQEALAAQAARQQEELRRKQVQEQMAQYRYLGYLNQNGVQKAFLGKGREIYIIRQGDKLDGRFVVAAIEVSIVKIRAQDSDLETTIKLKKEEGGTPGT